LNRTSDYNNFYCERTYNIKWKSPIEVSKNSLLDGKTYKCTELKGKGKGKAIPLQAWTDP